MKTGPLCQVREKISITPSEMRTAIFKSMHDRWNTNTIARRCDDAARHQGLNGEDATTLLAFHALCRVEELEARLLGFGHTAMRPPSFVYDPKVAVLKP